jgi:hypothetical protein
MKEIKGGFDMSMRDQEAKNLQRDYLERRIFLKRQLIQFTEKEIKALEDELNNKGKNKDEHS